MIEKYYEEELQYLYDSSCEFARAHPERARYLNIDSVGDRDPYIERLFEGFAFLAGRIRQKMDESFVMLTENLINLLWPQFLQEIPSIAIVQFQPRRGFLQESKILPRGSEILSKPYGDDFTVCRFSTTQPVVFNPLYLKNVIRETDNSNNEILSFVFNLDTSIKWDKYNLSCIRIFIHNEFPVAMILHRLLTTAVKKVEVKYDGNHNFYSLDPGNAIIASGFDGDQTLLPDIKSSFIGYNIIREYFVFPEKFLFVDFKGLDTIFAPRATPDTIVIKVTINEKIPTDFKFSATMFKLYCSPVANMFLYNTEPFIKSGMQSEYKVVADLNLKNIHVHSIRSVTGVDNATGVQYVYEPFHSLGKIDQNSSNTFATHFGKSSSGIREMNISFGGLQLNEKEIKKETIAIEAWCTNGDFARDALHESEINSPGRGFPDYIQISNITRPTSPVLPPLYYEYIWVFQTHLAANYSKLTNSGVLKKFLKMYNWSGLDGKNRKIEAIKDVCSEPVQTVYRGSLIFGVRFIVTLEEVAFEDSQDLHLFGIVLSKFLSQYVQINSFCELQFLLTPSGEKMTWSRTEGKQCLI